MKLLPNVVSGFGLFIAAPPVAAGPVCIPEGSAGSMLMVEAATGDILRWIAVPGAVDHTAVAPQPHHLTVIPGGTTLFVSSREDPVVWAVGAATLAQIGTIRVTGEGHRMVALP